MRTSTIEIGVGLFMLAGLIALLVLALNVSGLTMAKRDSYYTLYATFENIGGLTARSRVTVAGVTIGRVTGIELDTDTFSGVVEMQIKEGYDNLSTDTAAAILTSGLLGEKYVGLVTGADEEFLADGDLIEDTQSALVLEDLIGQFLFDSAKD